MSNKSLQTSALGYRDLPAGNLAHLPGRHTTLSMPGAHLTGTARSPALGPGAFSRAVSCYPHDLPSFPVRKYTHVTSPKSHDLCSGMGFRPGLLDPLQA